MAHTRAWSNTDPVIGDAAGAGYSEMNHIRVDVDERMSLQHYWADSTTYDGAHLLGETCVVDCAQAAATIIGGAYRTTAYNGSLALGSDDDIVYVKKGTANAADGTWTPANTSSSFWTHDGATLVFNATMSATWTDADISGTVGAANVLCFLEVKQSSGSDAVIYFRSNGATEDVGDGTTSLAGASACRLASGNIGYVVVETDASGIIEHKADASTTSVTVTLMGYIT